MPKIQQLDMHSFGLIRGFIFCYKACTPVRNVQSLFHHLNFFFNGYLIAERKTVKSEEILMHQEGQQQDEE